MYDSLKNKIALVTGATSGIGKQIARQLCEEKVTVIINYCNNEEQAKQTEQEFLESSYNFMLIKADISNETEVINMMNMILDKYGKLDYLVNNAGINIDNWIEEFSIEDFKKILNVNLVGKVICTKNSIPLMKKAGEGSIVNIASRLGVKPCEGSSAYCSAEAGIINFTGSCALELSKYNIRTNCISPSLTITPLAINGWTKEEMEQTKNKNPLKRLGETEDIANMTLFLLSDKANYINGENINVNGGSLLV